MRIHNSKDLRQRPRTFVGAVVLHSQQQIVGACVETVGKGFNARCNILGTAQVDLPGELCSQFDAICRENNYSSTGLFSFASELYEFQAKVIRQVIADVEKEATNVPCEPLAVGLLEPGLWSMDKSAIRSVINLSDPSRIAELAGLNVIDGFHSRDLAGGGNGGPIEPLAEWLLLHDSKRDRVLLNFDHTIRMTYLPSGYEASVAERVFATDIVPGVALLSAIADEFIGPDKSFEDMIKRSTEGHCDAGLLERWLDAPYFKEVLPRWTPYGVSCEWFVNVAKQWKQTKNLSSDDFLCTATHFIATAIVQCLEQNIPHSHSRIQVITAGQGATSGLMLQELGQRLSEVDLLPLAQVFNHEAHLDAANVALLAMLYVDQKPQTRPMISGIEAPRVLGRLTSGSPKNWQRLIKDMADSAPARMSLRSAV